MLYTYISAFRAPDSKIVSKLGNIISSYFRPGAATAHLIDSAKKMAKAREKSGGSSRNMVKRVSVQNSLSSLSTCIFSKLIRYNVCVPYVKNWRQTLSPKGAGWRTQTSVKQKYCNESPATLCC